MRIKIKASIGILPALKWTGSGVVEILKGTYVART
jgi:hypothetical protein